MKTIIVTNTPLAVALIAGCAAQPASKQPDLSRPLPEAPTCGPQAPRDISLPGGTNTIAVPTGETPNLCNVHFHKPFEHAGFAPFAAPASGSSESVCDSVVNGDQVEFHWVYTNCDLPSPPRVGLGNCVCDRADLTLRVFAQAYLMGEKGDELAQPSGDLVRYVGSTTGPAYDDNKCSAARVNWEVNRSVATLRRDALAGFCANNAWSETTPHGIRALVQREDWLAPFRP